jgi:hypothetical protein
VVGEEVEGEEDEEIEGEDNAEVEDEEKDEVVVVVVGGDWSRGLPFEDLPEEPSHLHLIRRHRQERQGYLHKVPSPGAL